MSASIICSGALFYTLNTNRFLFLHRSNGKKSDVWGLVGGTNEAKETPWEGLKREIIEEIGELPPLKKTLPLESFLSNDKKSSLSNNGIHPSHAFNVQNNTKLAKYFSLSLVRSEGK